MINIQVQVSYRNVSVSDQYSFQTVQAFWWISIQTQNLDDQNSKYLTVPNKNMSKIE